MDTTDRATNTEMPTPIRKTLTIPEAGQELGICRSAAYEAARRNEIPTIRIGRRLLVPVAALEKLLSGEAALST